MGGIAFGDFHPSQLSSVPLAVYFVRRGCDVSLCSLLDSGVSGVKRSGARVPSQSSAKSQNQYSSSAKSPSKDTAGLKVGPFPPHGGSASDFRGVL